MIAKWKLKYVHMIWTSCLFLAMPLLSLSLCIFQVWHTRNCMKKKHDLSSELKWNAIYCATFHSNSIQIFIFSFFFRSIRAFDISAQLIFHGKIHFNYKSIHIAIAWFAVAKINSKRMENVTLKCTSARKWNNKWIDYILIVY